ncbi:Hypothetical predicted protein [Mytilus galloprovincialis]|uniref:Reverse transcriptase domain-containing protein n=1 Tax=Mytilus galloprovincialis TaxID=29158 RepID=A0A8B6EQH6_MYTGA|nr:Hypothetical predicted protein [Mytilus galloprovincialis]
MRVLKKKLRSEQRKIESAKRQSKFTDIMSLSDRNDKNFYTLINNQRNLRSSVTSILKYDNKIINTEEEILDTWASYYEKLATPVDNPDFDDTYKLIVEQDISALTDTYTNNRDTLAPVSEKEVVQIINSLKNGKAPDASRKGFTQGEIPLVAALILTELHTEAKENGNPLITALTDAKSAFDVVWHDGLLREMNKAGLCGDNWLLFKDWYNVLNSNIKMARTNVQNIPGISRCPTGWCLVPNRL